ncbi:MAG: exosortase C-terminal domain/associated protein EpsI [Phycisphaeraceae bacterium]
MSESSPATSAKHEREIRAAEARVAALAASQTAPPSGPARRSPLIGLLLTLALVCIGWWGTFAWMWDRWFPHWKFANESLGDRLTNGDSYYTHGPLVLLTAVVAAFFIYKRVGAPAVRTRLADTLGWLGLIFCATLHLVSVYAGVGFASGFALIGVLCSALLVWGGWPLLRAYWLPVLILVFMVPLPETAIDGLNFRLKIIASQASIWIVNNVIGIPTVLSGSDVLLPPNADGTPKSMVVEDACSGLRSLISLTFFASLFAVVCRVKGLWRWFMLLMAVPVAIASNVVRITVLTVASHHLGVEVATPGASIHDLSGIAVFGVALAILFGLEYSILGMGKLMRRNWGDPRLMGYLERIPRGLGSLPRIGRPAFLGVMALVAALSVVYAREPATADMTTLARNVSPGTVTLPDGTEFVGGSYLEMTRKEMEILENPSYVSRHYVTKDQGRSFDLMVIFSANNRKAVHPPEICLKGGGFNVIDKTVRPIAIPGRSAAPMRELYTQWGSNNTYFLYVYKSGDSYTPSFFMQQATVFYNGLVGRWYGQNSAGALIRITVPVMNQSREQAHALAVAVAEQLMPHLDRELKQAEVSGGKEPVSNF